jgi:hypothetical protein
MVNKFVIWPHRPDWWKDFLDHLNSIRWNIQVITEIKTDGHLPFLYIGDPMALWAIRCTVNLPIPTST